ncbi:hypothetical protein A7E78_00835 [Syntrophotalea acetylenivorans]|uniref:Uncharacterized protein n=1 Tax=Syntrophotalea acetylenivorans TaxID=1842532 RepID=A0A1L3GKQ7_9BACT|nr:hypothetical protein A7E78_00835 [Syntrophotalea acetylenivorans]
MGHLYPENAAMALIETIFVELNTKSPAEGYFPRWAPLPKMPGHSVVSRICHLLNAGGVPEFRLFFKMLFLQYFYVLLKF